MHVMTYPRNLKSFYVCIYGLNIHPFFPRIFVNWNSLISQRDWQGTDWREDEKNGKTDSAFRLGRITEQKGILGPGPAELRFPEAL